MKKPKNVDGALRREQFPLKTDTLPRETYEKLLLEVFRVLHQQYGLPLRNLTGKLEGIKNAEFFGMGDFAPEKSGRQHTSVASAIAEHEQVKQFVALFPDDCKVTNFGDFLYKRLLNDQKQQEASIKFGRKPYVYCYFLFLGFNNRQEFEAAHQIAHHKAVAVPGETFTYFICSFFSFRSYRVKHFVLGIDLQNPTREGNFPAESWGFHRLELDTDKVEKVPVLQDDSQKLVGAAIFRNYFIYINLAGQSPSSSWTQMNLIGRHIADNSRLLVQQVKQQQIIRCSLQTTSVFGYPVNMETLMTQVSDDKSPLLRQHNGGLQAEELDLSVFLDTDRINTLLLYLMLQRRNFWVRNNFVQDLFKLEIKGTLIRNHAYLRGTWRIWNFGMRRNYVVESKLLIDDNYSAHFYPALKPAIFEQRENLREQVAVLSLSRGIQPDKFFFSTYAKPNLSIINYAIFDLGTMQTKKYAEGMFVSCGYDNQGIIGGYCVMIKAREGEAFQPAEYSGDAIIAYAQRLGLRHALDGLRSLWKEKTWKNRKYNNPDSNFMDDGAGI